jgi:hypothetical protein
MKRILLLALSISFVPSLALRTFAATEEGHSHTEHKKEESHSEEEEEHDEGAGDSAGPDKGLLSISVKDGLRFSPEALKSFGITTEKLATIIKVILPKSALVVSGEAESIYRLRDGFFKRLPVKAFKQPDGKVQVEASDLRVGDEVVLQGAPFLRVVELDAAGGSEHGHGH